MRQNSLMRLRAAYSNNSTASCSFNDCFFIGL
nr:MAG TPA: hypothetical protein [Caudoviricetes sp.]